MRIIAYFLYYYFAKHLPRSYDLGMIGRVSQMIRVYLCKWLFCQSGRGSGVERGADFGGGRNVIVHEYGQIGENARFMGEGTITIGQHAIMGPDVIILTSDHKMTEKGYEGYIHKDVVIDDHAWIGARAVILKGVKIGKYAIVGAGAVVTKSVGDYEVVGGNPARLIKKNNVKEN